MEVGRRRRLLVVACFTIFIVPVVVYSPFTRFVFAQEIPKSKSRASNSAAPTADTAGNPAPSRAEIVSEKFYLPLSGDEAQKLYREVVQYHDAIEIAKLYGPIVVFLVLTGIPFAVNYFVKTSVYETKETLKNSLKEEIREEFQEKTKQASDALRNAEERTTEKYTRLEEVLNMAIRKVEVRQDSSKAIIAEALALQAWRSNDLRAAIHYAGLALRALESVLPRMSDDSKDVQEHWRSYKVSLGGNLAFYYALSYKATNNGEHRCEARELARSLYVGLNNIDKGRKLSQTDNYLFVGWTVGVITDDDKDKWIGLFNENRDRLVKYFEEEKGYITHTISDYDNFLASLKPSKV